MSKKLKNNLPVLVTIVKISDDMFDGKHPNGVNEGYLKEGFIDKLPIIGQPFYVESFRTSVVFTELDKNNTFKTKNSTYKLIFK